MKITKKRKNVGLQIITKNGSKGNYLFIKTPNNSYHAFLEVAAKDAAKDCGAVDSRNTRQLCKLICKY